MAITTPDWVKHAVFYQIFPDRLRRGHDPEHPDWAIALEPWDAPPTPQGYKGGNLWGVIDHLDYLQDLGITAIYFTPIFQSASNHRYHTHDYFQVDPILGGNIAFMKLLEEAHRRHIKVVLDGVFNHASRGFFMFHDILENGGNSPWLDWFKIDRFPLAPYDGDRPANYQSWDHNRALPQFNHEHPPVREYIMQIAEYWLNLGIDGWRLDVPACITASGFWQEFRDRVKAINPQAYIVGEIWEDARPWLDGTQFDGVMNYLFTTSTVAFVVGDRVQPQYLSNPSYQPVPALNAAAYAQQIQALLSLYDWQIQLTQLNLLNSHDIARLSAIANSDEASMELATILLLTFPGAPSIYYGDEVGLSGGIDPDNRRGFPSTWDLEILAYHRQLIQIRHAHPALRIGSYQVLWAEGSVYIFARQTTNQIADQTVNQIIIVAINCGTEPVDLNLDLSLSAILPSIEVHHEVLYGKGKFKWNQTNLNLILPARSGTITKF